MSPGLVCSPLTPVHARRQTGGNTSSFQSLVYSPHSDSAVQVMQRPDHDQSHAHVRLASCLTTDYPTHRPHQNWIDAAVRGTAPEQERVVARTHFRT